MTDEELVKMARLAQRDDRMSTGALYGDLAARIEALIVEKKYLLERVMEQDDRIEQLVATNKALTVERDEHWKSFVHWRKEADALTEQRAKAVEAMEFWLQAQEPDFDAAIDLMQATLAELKGRPRG